MRCLGFSGRSKRRQRGFVLATMVVSTVALLACVGLAIDAGYLQFVKSRMQIAADAAAIGGVQEIKQNGTTHASDAAKADSALNGFTNGQNSVLVTVNNPPLSGYYPSDGTAVEAIVSQSVHILFMSVLGFNSVTVRARSVARQGSGSSCLYTLDPSAKGAFTDTGGSSVSVGCGIVVDSSNSAALKASGGAHVTATSIGIVGNYDSTGGSVLSPTPVTGVSPVTNPLSYLTPPSVGACWQNNWSVSGGAVTSIAPGVYCGGISISGGSTVTMSAGTYILLGGGLKVSGGSILSDISGVTFYNTYGTGHAYGAISISGGGDVQLTAPTTGPLAGILFYQDPNVGAGAASTITGGASTFFQGALYFPTTALSYSGGASAAYTIIVADTVSFTGGTVLNADYSSLPNGSPIKGNAAVSE